jgi:type I restriction enzyme, S subunit
LPEFAQAYFQHRLYTGQFAAMCVQTTSMAHLTAVRFAAMLMPVPPLDEQASIAELAKTTSATAAALKDRVAQTVALTPSLDAFQ